MTDIVSRLHAIDEQVAKEAADEIERLQGENRLLRKALACEIEHKPPVTGISKTDLVEAAHIDEWGDPIVPVKRGFRRRKPKAARKDEGQDGR